VVLEAMSRAADAFVDMHALQRAVSAELAVLTHNEAAHVCSGASAGLVLATLACMTGNDERALGRLLQGGPAALPRRDLVIHCVHRNPYDLAGQLAGARLVQVGNALQTFEWELEAALGEQTAAVLYLAGERFAPGALPLEVVIRHAKAAGVPVIVDAAAQLPPPENLWRFTQAGADLVIFSGGKALRGPQASGLIVGRSAWIEACRLHAAPHQRLARPMKVGKEEMMGLLAAVRWYLALDHASIAARWERVVEDWVDALSALPGVCARRAFPGEAGQPVLRALVTLDASLAFTSEALHDALLAGTPPVDVATAGDRCFYLNPELLEPGEETIVVERVRATMARVDSWAGVRRERKR
jgi:uncharacterized pyridoxal phosphate-dependent enzyme